MPGGLQPHRRGSPLRQSNPALGAMLRGRAAGGAVAPNPQNVKKNAALLARAGARAARKARPARKPR